MRTTRRTRARVRSRGRATNIKTNLKLLADQFRNKKCDNTHKHVEVQSTFEGVKLSTYSQIYPQPMCKAIADVVGRLI